MANILEFLRQNPEMAFRLLQAGGGALGQIGGQFDEASAYNSQARAGRRNSLVGALSLGQVPGTAQGRMPSPGFLSTLGQSAELIGGMGSMAYDLKRQKAEEEYQKEMRALQKKEAMMSIRANELSIADKEAEAARKEGVTLYTTMAKSFKAARAAELKKDIPNITPDQIDPSQLPIPETYLQKLNPLVRQGFENQQQVDHAIWFSEYVEKEKLNMDKMRSEAERARAMAALKNAENDAKKAGQTDLMEALKIRRQVLEASTARLEKSFGTKDAADFRSGFNTFLSGMKQGNADAMAIGISKMVDPASVVRESEARTMLQSAMTKLGFSVQETSQWFSTDNPEKLNPEGVERIKGLATKLYEQRLDDIYSALGAVAQDYDRQGEGTPFDVSVGDVYQANSSFILPDLPDDLTQYSSKRRDTGGSLLNKGDGVKFKDESPDTTGYMPGPLGTILGVGGAAIAAKQLAQPMYNAATSIPGIDAEFFRGQSSALHKDLTDVPFKGMMNPELPKLGPGSTTGQALLPPGPASPPQLTSPPIQMPSGLKALGQNTPPTQNAFNYGQIEMPGNPMKQLPNVARSIGSDAPNVAFQDPDMPVRQNTSQLLRRATSAEELTPSQFVKASRIPAIAKALGIGTTAALMIPSLVDYGLERNAIPGLDTLTQRNLRRFLGVPRVID